MENYAVPSLLVWTAVFFIFSLMISILYTIYYFYSKYNKKDIALIIDKTNKWRMHYLNFTGKGRITVEGKTYVLAQDCGKLNSKGKALYVFSENKPTPLNWEYNKAKWLDADTLMSVINNDIVKQIVKPTDAARDMLILLGAIGGILAGLASILILLIQVGVIKA